MADKEVAPIATVESSSSPALVATAKKTAKSKKPEGKPTRPRTSDMVTAAITDLKERGGSSLQAIKKYIASTFKLDSEKLAPFIKKHLRAAVASGALVQTKGKGASGSFKLPTSKTPAVPKSKKAVTKPAAAKKPASPKKSAAAKKPIAAKNPAATKKAAATKKTETAVKAVKKPAAAKKPAAKKPVVEKKKATPPTKSTSSKAAKSPSKVKKVTKAPTNKPKAPRPKRIRTKQVA